MASFTPGVRIIIIVSVSEAHNWRALCGSSLLWGEGGGEVSRMKWEENQLIITLSRLENILLKKIV